MNTKMLRRLLLIIAASTATGCANTNVWTAQQRPWDPPAGRALYEQIPAWDGAALTQCCGATPSKCQRHQTDRC